MKRHLFTIVLALACLVSVARGQDDPNPLDRSYIRSGDNQQTILLKHIWRRLGGPGDTATGTGSALGSTGTTVTTQTPVKVTASGTLAAGSRGPTFVFSSDFAGTLQGSAAGVIQPGTTVSPTTPAGTTQGAIAYTITAGSITIYDVR